MRHLFAHVNYTYKFKLLNEQKFNGGRSNFSFLSAISIHIICINILFEKLCAHGIWIGIYPWSIYLFIYLFSLVVLLFIIYLVVMCKWLMCTLYTTQSIFSHIICIIWINNRSIENTIYWNNASTFYRHTNFLLPSEGVCVLFFYTPLYAWYSRVYCKMIALQDLHFILVFNRHKYYINHHHTILAFVVFVRAELHNI